MIPKSFQKVPGEIEENNEIHYNYDDDTANDVSTHPTSKKTKRNVSRYCDCSIYNEENDDLLTLLSICIVHKRRKKHRRHLKHVFYCVSWLKTVYYIEFSWRGEVIKPTAEV